MTTPDSANPPAKASSLKKTLVALTLGGASGYFGARAFLDLGHTGDFGTLGMSEYIAGLFGLSYILIGGLMGIGLILPKAGATFLNVEDAEELTEQRTMLASSTLALIALGIALIVAALAEPAGTIRPGIVVAVFAVTGVLAIVLGVLSYRHQDELMRALGRESAAVAFYLLALTGGIWALAGHLEYTAPPAPLDWLTMIWGLMLLAAFIVVGKHGMMKMR